MLKIILQDQRYLYPFNEPARDLRIQNKPLWLSQRDVLAPYTDRELELRPWDTLPETREACLVYRDNLFFDAEFINAFLSEAQKRKTACRVALSADDPAFREHALPLSNSYTPLGRAIPGRPVVFPGRGEARARRLGIDDRHRAAGDRPAAHRGGLLPRADLHGLRAGRPGIPGAQAQPAGNRFLGAHLHCRRGLWAVRAWGALRGPARAQRDDEAGDDGHRHV